MFKVVVLCFLSFSSVHCFVGSFLRKPNVQRTNSAVRCFGEHANAVGAACMFSKVCVTQENIFYFGALATQPDTLLTYGRIKDAAEVAYKGDLVQPIKVVERMTTDEMTRGQWVKRTHVLLTRIAAGNAGHLLHEALLPAFQVAQAFNVNPLRTSVALRDAGDTRLESVAHFGYPVELGDMLTEQLHSLIFNSSITALSSKPVCFNKLIVGIAQYGTLFNSNQARGHGLILFRNHVYKRLRIPRRSVLKQPYLILIHEKPLEGRHGHAIANVDQLVNELTSMLDPEVATVRRFVMEDLSVPEQIHLLSRTAMYVPTPGSASFMALFMPDHSTMVALPLVDGNRDAREVKYNYWLSTVHTHISHVRCRKYETTEANYMDRPSSWIENSVDYVLHSSRLRDFAMEAFDVLNAFSQS